MKIKNVSDLQKFSSERSRFYQTIYFSIMVLSIILPVIVILINFIIQFNQDLANSKVTSVILSCIFIISMLLIIPIHFTKIEKNWFLYRAFSESLKTQAWLTIFSPNYSDFETKFEKFSKDTKDYIFGNTKIDTEMAGFDHNLSQQLISLHGKNNEEKLLQYEENRLKTQLEYYSTNAKKNNKRNNRYNLFLFLIYGIAIISLIVKSEFQLNWSLYPILAAIGSALISWKNLKDYASLSESYGQTEKDLRKIQDYLKENKNELISDDTKLYDFIEGAENAISNEHKVWIARRTGKIL